MRVAQRLWRGVLLGIVDGLFAGITGVGGGVILVPMLSGWLGLDQHRAQATSLSIVLPTALVATLTYASKGNVQWSLAVPIALASVGTVFFSARWVRRIPAQHLRRVFGGVVVVVALRLLLWG